MVMVFSEKESSIKNIIFDLDGTIIDSGSGIQEAYNYAYEKVYARTCTHNIRGLVGPPIKDIFAKISGEQDQETIDFFVNFFQESYDSENYKVLELYSGIKEILLALKRLNKKIFIATNKRVKPTLLILDHLNLRDFFDKIYCIDSPATKYPNKTEMVSKLMSAEHLVKNETILIGDTNHDMIAARNNNIEFIFASYGFGEIKLTDIKYKIGSASEIVNFFSLE